MNGKILRVLLKSELNVVNVIIFSHLWPNTVTENPS